MLLCLDMGNSQLYAGVVDKGKVVLRFRHSSNLDNTSDQLGVFLRNVLRENSINPDKIKSIAICSVVPHLDYSMIAACKKYFKLTPFMLQAGVKTGLQIKVNNPLEVGADRIANAISAIHQFPNKNLIIVDFGTATTFCGITKKKEYLGGTILAGIKLSMNALTSNTAKLSSVEIKKPERACGRTTISNIQSGLYYGHIGIIKELTKQFTLQEFQDETPVIIGTGGFAHLFQSDNLFDSIEQDLVFHGLAKAHELNN